MLNRKRAACLFGLIASLCSSQLKAAQIGEAIGQEFSMGADSNRLPTRPVIARDAVGGIVGLWEQFGDDAATSGNGIYGTRIAASGSPIPSPFLVNSTTAFQQEQATLASAPDGRFVAVWRSARHTSGNDALVGRYFSSSGSTPEFIIDTGSGGTSPGEAAVAMEDSGRFFVVWKPLNGVLLMRRFDIDGTPLTNEIRVDDSSIRRGEATPSVAISPAGRVVVAWTDDTPARGVASRIFDANGVAIGAPFSVSTNVEGSTSSPQAQPVAGIDDAGNFTISWTNARQILARRYAADGTPLTGEVALSSPTTRTVQRPRLALNADGTGVVAWGVLPGSNPEGTPGAIRFRRIDAAANPIGTETEVATTDALSPEPDVAADADGDFALIWLQASGSGTPVVAQRFVGPESVDLGVSLSLSSADGTTCDPSNYIVTLDNNHPAASGGVGAASSATLTLTLAEGSEFLGTDGGLLDCDAASVPLTCYIGVLQPGESRTETIRTLAPTVPGLVTSSASLTADHVDADTGNDETSFTQPIAQGAPAGMINLAVQPASTMEGNSISVVATRSGGTNCRVGAMVRTVGGNATANKDYWALVESLSWPDGDSEPRTAVIQSLDDDIAEGAETIHAQLEQVTVAETGTASVDVTLEDNDTAGLQFLVPGSEFVLEEGASYVSYQVRLLSQPTHPVTIQISGERLQLAPGTLQFDATNWNDVQQVRIQVVDDNVRQGKKTVVLTHAVSSADPYYNLPPVTADIQIIDDEPSPTGAGSVQAGPLLLMLLALVLRLSSLLPRAVN